MLHQPADICIVLKHKNSLAQTQVSSVALNAGIHQTQLRASFRDTPD